MSLIIGDRERGLLEEIIRTLAQQPDYPQERNYGYFTVRDRHSGQVSCILRIGQCPRERGKRFLALSMEKGSRLFETKELSSWQSRNPDQGMWGGAIATKEFILSFSGLPEKADEALMLKYAQIRKLIDEEAIVEIAEASNNTFFPL